MRPNLSPRTPNDILMRHMGGHSLKEARQMMEQQSLKQYDKQRLEQQTEALDVIVDRLVAGETPDPKLIKRWFDRGGQPKELPDAILGQMKARAQEAVARYIGSSKGLSFAEKAQRLDKFNLMLKNTDNQHELADTIRKLEHGN